MNFRELTREEVNREIKRREETSARSQIEIRRYKSVISDLKKSINKDIEDLAMLYEIKKEMNESDSINM